jgi:hypothetical protein
VLSFEGEEWTIPLIPLLLLLLLLQHFIGRAAALAFRLRLELYDGGDNGCALSLAHVTDMQAANSHVHSGDDNEADPVMCFPLLISSISIYLLLLIVYSMLERD